MLAVDTKNMHQKSTFTNPASKGSTETLQLTYMFPNCWQDIPNSNIYLFIISIPIFIFDLRNTCQLNLYFDIGYWVTEYTVCDKYVNFLNICC